MGMGFPVGTGFPCDTHGNGNEKKTHFHGNGNCNGNDFHGSGNVEKIYGSKIPICYQIYHIIRVSTILYLECACCDGMGIGYVNDFLSLLKFAFQVRCRLYNIGRTMHSV